MPYIEAKLSLTLNENEKNDLQKKLTSAVSTVFGKPKAYIMANIEDKQTLYMAENKAEKTAYISISLLGSASKEECQALTQEVCAILQNDFGIEGRYIYVTYHPTQLWGWNGTMF